MQCFREKVLKKRSIFQKALNFTMNTVLFVILTVVLESETKNKKGHGQRKNPEWSCYCIIYEHVAAKLHKPLRGMAHMSQ